MEDVGNVLEKVILIANLDALPKDLLEMEFTLLENLMRKKIAVVVVVVALLLMIICFI